MRVLSLFSGIGGFDLAAEWAGCEVVGQVEIDPFCNRVLVKHWPDVKRIEDIKDVKGTEFGAVDLICGGFPCQPFSCAGKRKGKDDSRHLWPEMCRVIREAQPEWVLAENVSGLLSQDGGLVFEHVLTDLEDAGYETLPLVIPACGVGAPHRRDRVWIVGRTKEQLITESKGSNGERNTGELVGQTQGQEELRAVFTNDARHAPDTRCLGQKVSKRTGWSENWLEAAPRLCRMDDGIPRQVDRVNRLKALGNSIVPQIAYELIRAMKEVRW